MNTDVCVAIPTIPPRQKMCVDAIRSVMGQTHRARQIVVQTDENHEGAPATRNLAIRASDCTWTALLDDDDLMDPDHLAHLIWCAETQGADLVSSWMRVTGGGHDPFPHHRGVAFDPDIMRIFPIAWMVRTDLIHRAMDEMGGFQPDPDGTGGWHIQDYPVIRHMLVDLGGKHYASPEITWSWAHHGRNTAGVGSRW